MNLCVRNVFISLWLALTYTLSAQPGLSFPIVNDINPGELVNFQCKVKNFDSIVGMQYVMRWDPAVFEFVSTGTYNLADLGSDDFSTNQAKDSGIVRLLWVSSNLLGGVTVDDETPIYRLRLKAIGAVGTGSSIYFTQDNITPFDVTRANSDSSLTSFGIDEVEIMNGFGAIGYTVSAGEPSRNNGFEFTVAPNPFVETTTVRFDLAEPCDVTMLLTDATGRILLEKTMLQMQAGQHGTEIASPHLRYKGIYFLILRAGPRISTRSLSVH